MRNEAYLVPQDWLKQRVMSVRVPLQIHHAVNELRARAERAGFSFDVQGVMVEALERAIREAEGQLQAIEQGDGVAPSNLVSKRPRSRSRRGSELGKLVE